MSGIIYVLGLIEADRSCGLVLRPQGNFPPVEYQKIPALLGQRK